MTRICEKHNIEYEIEKVKLFDREYELSTCPKCAEERINEERIEKEKAEAEKIKEKLSRMNIEPLYYDVTLENFITDTNELEKAKQKVYELIKKKNGKIVMLGKNGTGKTHLAISALKEITGVIYTMYEISARIRASYTVNAHETELDIVDGLSNAPLLVIDEIGRTKGSESEANWLSYIIDKRHSRNLPLILISNKHDRKSCKSNGCESCIENYIGDDIMSRLSDGGVMLRFTGDDYRRHR